jgi:DNA-binding transcriptional LysR family regulator
MELRQLRYFIAIAERLSFSKAARDLHVTVPPLSRQIRQLEDEFGVQLFVRDRKRVALSDAGQLFLREAKVLVTQTEHMSECVKRAKNGEAGLVRVGVGLGLGERISRVLIEHAKRYPLVETQCTELFSSLQTDLLAKGDIDVGFWRPSRASAPLNTEFLFEEGLIVLVSKESPLAKRKALHMRDLAGETLLIHERSLSSGLYDKTFELYQNAGIIPCIIRLPSEPTARGDIQTILLACRKGIFIMPDEVASHPAAGSEVVAVPLDEPGAKVAVHAVWRADETSAVVLSFLNSVRTVFPRPGLNTTYLPQYQPADEAKARRVE